MSTETLSRDGHEIVASPGIHTRADLLAILPPAVRDVAHEQLLSSASACAALRLLSLIPSTSWHASVCCNRIDHWRLMADTRGRGTDRERALARAAAHFLTGELSDSLPGLVHGLDDEGFTAFIDALRIAWEGLE